MVAAFIGCAGTVFVASPAHAALDDQAIEGTVVVEGLVGSLAGATVSVTFIGVPTDPDSSGATGIVQADGSYHVGLYEPGNYKVCVQADLARNWAEACWMNGGAVGTIAVAANEVVTGKTITTTQLGGLRGQLKVGTSGSNHTAPDAVASLYRNTGSGYEYVGESYTYGINGYYSFASIEPGTYALEFADRTGQHSREYWDDARYWPERTEITVAAGPTTLLGLTILAPRYDDVNRLAGPDRFATAVAISQAQFPTGADVPVIYVANGLNYPDALSAGPAATHLGGGMLLVLPNAIPDVVGAELERLNPDRIVVVGATGAIEPKVKKALEAYVDSPADVDRIGGSDRFETSRLLVEDAFLGLGGTGAAEAFIATGLNFPDALATVPAAGVRDAPLILVAGNASTIDTKTRGLLTDLGVEAIHIAGGSGVVSDGIAASAASIVGGDNVVRYAGVNRFATAVLISIGTFTTADYAFVANGYGFADALAGGPLAGAIGAPIYLSEQACLPYYVLQDIDEVGANRVTLLGATGVLSSAVKSLTSCGSPAEGSPQPVEGLLREGAE